MTSLYREGGYNSRPADLWTDDILLRGPKRKTLDSVYQSHKPRNMLTQGRRNMNSIWKDMKRALNPGCQSDHSQEQEQTTESHDPSSLVVSGNFTKLYSDPADDAQGRQDLRNNNQDRSDPPGGLYVNPQREVSASGDVHGTFLFKVLVIGDPNSGKTSLIQRYVSGAYTMDYKATLGVDFALKVVRWSDNVSIKLQLWDIAGQERFTSMTRVYYRDAHACIIMFDLTNRGSFLNALKWKKDLDQKCTLPDGSPVPCMLLANKCDLGSREVDQAEIEGFCRKQDFIGWTETSVKEGLMVEESMRFLLDDMIARYAERNPGVTDSEALDLDRKQTIYLQSSELSQPHSKCSCS